ncbi:MAG: efflux RND transporter periplasmic adaptor subunit [Bacteroidota bacterium]|nr:efflux RND transporter periplasmic adaptor subunit [Odoribacter sp.]MDP3643990.1 efflux RND transporter periplasmic adaptor subunit [Bacteroidota bacterium]
MKRQTILTTGALILGIFLGWAVFHSPEKKEESHNHSAQEKKAEIWTCSMHPQIRMDKPGKCPICAMDLILLHSNTSSESDVMAVHLTKEAAALANVLTSVVSVQTPVKELRLYGKVQADERLLQNQVAYIPGRIENLMINFTGEMVRKGQPLALIYSPELVTAQQELLEAGKTKLAQPEIYEAAKEKLRQWKLTDKQISEIENSGKVQANMEVESTANGIVTARRVNNGDYVSQGSVLFEVSDLSRVWILFDAYESDLPFLKKGDEVEFTIQALPGSAYSGTIMFIDPVIDPVNRVAKVRLEMSNPGAKLKPGMFATGIVKSNLDEFNNKLVIPRTAVLWTGKRSIVYVKQPGEEPVFKIREIELGPQLGNSYVVIDGLTDGEEIVTQGAFSVDAAAQLEGKPSMMNPSGGKVSSMPGMDMPGENKSSQKIPAETHPMTSSHQMSEQIKVSGNCEQCKDRIESAAKSVSGVNSAEWSSETKMLHVQFDGAKTNSDVIQKAIAKVGHDTEKFKASVEVYKQLPECCLYRK